jgi:branched-chain amino acid transport system ATP-binding protein
VRNLAKSFGPVIAARGISVDLATEQTVGIIGANGAGKTTFVNMITGHLAPSAGTIVFEGRDIAGLPSRTITRLGICRSFQVAQVFPMLTVHENLCAAAAVAGGSASVLRQALVPMRSARNLAQVDAIVELFGLGLHRDARAATLSQGVRKLLDIGMAICGDPKILLLDEPTSGISVEEKYELMETVVAALRQRGITVLFVEHDMDIVGRFADRILAFYDGGVISDGHPGAVLADARVQELITGTHRRPPVASEPAHA